MKGRAKPPRLLLATINIALLPSADRQRLTDRWLPHLASKEIYAAMGPNFSAPRQCHTLFAPLADDFCLLWSHDARKAIGNMLPIGRFSSVRV